VLKTIYAPKNKKTVFSLKMAVKQGCLRKMSGFGRRVKMSCQG
jgi:hypothetical protein